MHWLPHEIKGGSFTLCFFISPLLSTVQNPNSPCANARWIQLLSRSKGASRITMSPLPPRFLESAQHRREEVFEDGARAEVDLGGDLHAGREAVAHAVGVEVLRLEVDQRAVGERQVAAGLAAGLLLRVGVARVGGKVRDLPFDHAVFLELVGGEFDLDRLSGVDEADVLVADPDFGAQGLTVWHEGHEDGAGADDGADGVGGEVLDDAILRGLEFVQAAAVLLLGEFALDLVESVLDVGALGLELAAVVGAELGKFAGGLGEAGLGALDEVFLRFEILFLFDAFARLVVGHDLAGEAVAGESLEGASGEFGLRRGNLVSVKARIEVKAVDHKSGEVVAIDRETAVEV